ncbi:hypothetical protein BGZ83_006416 [Gryganskiella cystojenkinii]|nr:hypothetical protein BGZ83_006416 [Gryganskiella cystojenkinii]
MRVPSASFTSGVSLAFLVASSSLPTATTAATVATTLVQNAPSATSLEGAHLLLDNDIDSTTSKYPVIYLSKPMSYKESKDACAKLGEDLVQSSGYGNLTELLSNTPIAQTEVKGIRRVWVNNGNDNSHCAALDRQNGSIVRLSCSTKLPALCKNSVSRTINGGFNNDKSKQVTVQTRRVGTYQGYRDQNAFRFLGIPYAQAPVGNLRFVAPRRWAPGNKNKGNDSSFSTVMDATDYGDVCNQFDPSGATSNVNQFKDSYGAKQSEDCLYLNVFTPTLKANKVKGLPVMVFVHGGGYWAGGSSNPTFEPGNLVSRGGVVVVTLNYRLSMFGLFENTPAISRSKAPGNLPSRDQVAALLWVRENIAAFGGNPSEVTIFGETAGAWSMRALLSAPSAFGLYKNVISLSDPLAFPFSSPQLVTSELGAQMMKALGCQGSDLACAQNRTVNEIQTAQLQAVQKTLAMPKNKWIFSLAIFRPTVDGSFIPADFAELVRTGRHNKKANIMFGSTRDEWRFFIPSYYQNPVAIANATEEMSKLWGDTSRIQNLFENSTYYKYNSSDSDTVRDVWSKAGTALNFWCPLQMLSRAVVKSGGSGKVYAYRMDHGRDGSGGFGPVLPFFKGHVCHTDDLLPAFGSGDSLKGSAQTGDDARFSRQVIDRFSTFAKTGNPNPVKGAVGSASSNQDLGVQWPVYSASNPIFHFDVTNSSVISNADTEKCNWIAKNVRFDYQVHGPSGKILPNYSPIA